MKLTDDKIKLELVSRLVKEGHIDFTEAIKLLEEPEGIVIKLDNTIPWSPPFIPTSPNNYPIITYTTNNLLLETDYSKQYKYEHSFYN